MTTDLLERVTALYRFEGEVRGQPPDVRKQKRQENTKSLVDELRAAIDDAFAPLVAQVRDGQGTRLWSQALNRADTLLDDGFAEIDNNIAGTRDAQRRNRPEELALRRFESWRRARRRHIFGHRNGKT